MINRLVNCLMIAALMSGYLVIGNIAGLQFKIINTFGGGNTEYLIKMNADTFAKQFGPSIVFNGWCAIVVIACMLLIVGIKAILFFRDKYYEGGPAIQSSLKNVRSDIKDSENLM